MHPSFPNEQYNAINAGIKNLILQTYGTVIPEESSWGSPKPPGERDAESILYEIGYAVREISAYEQQRCHYPYIAYYPVDFVWVARHGKQLLGDTPARFIDVGCGIGDKLLIAQQYAGIEDVTGIEYNEVTVDIARRTLADTSIKVVQGDAFQHDFGPYNLIYFYCPIMRHDIMMDLFLHVARSAPEGAIIMEMLTSYFPHNCRCTTAGRLFRCSDFLRCLYPDVFNTHKQGHATGLFRKRDGKLDMLYWD